MYDVMEVSILFTSTRDILNFEQKMCFYFLSFYRIRNVTSAQEVGPMSAVRRV